jgi:hypothetical protein
MEIAFRRQIIKILDTRSLAIKRYHWRKKKVCNHDVLNQRYHQFITDYISVDLMLKITHQFDARKRHKIFLHNGVYIKSDPASKIRVVFDASAKSSKGYSFYESTIKNQLCREK